MSIDGAIYLPGHTVTYAGNGGNAPSCTQIIAEQIKVTGASLFKHQCAGTGVLDPGVTWALVEWFEASATKLPRRAGAYCRASPARRVAASVWS